MASVNACIVLDQPSPKVYSAAGRSFMASVYACTVLGDDLLKAILSWSGQHFSHSRCLKSNGADENGAPLGPK